MADAPLGPLLLSLGEPAGIGPEIVAKAWRALSADGPAFAVVGDAALLEAQGLPVRRVVSLGETHDARGALAVLHRPLPAPVTPGVADPANGPAVIDWIETAVALVLAGEARGLVTAPIAKASLYAAGFRFPGHTEFIAELTAGAPFAGERGPVMMLATEGLRACLVTIHLPLSEVSELVTEDRVVRTARVTHEALMRDFGVTRPRLALAALNPHAGEGGSLGREEIEVLAPAVARLRAEGVDISDPRPADTLFHAEARRTYDAAVCLYHDQALIPVKTLDFWGGVNVSLGLPIVRTSPDHGTGFDIVGKAVARADSLIRAIRMADEMATMRARA